VLPVCKFCILCIFFIFSYFYYFSRQVQERQQIPLIGTGFHSYIDHIIWNLPFSNVKQAYATLDAMEGVTEADWETKCAEIAAELMLERAQQDLSAQRRRSQPAFIMIMIMKLVSVSDGWKAWLKENGPVNLKGRCGTKEVIRPAGRVTSRVRD
jgi:hypothetical protein